jgi:hypothetical protein
MTKHNPRTYGFVIIGDEFDCVTNFKCIALLLLRLLLVIPVAPTRRTTNGEWIGGGCAGSSGSCGRHFGLLALMLSAQMFTSCFPSLLLSRRDE